jgi:mannose/fructose/N-acetylgalactosamine-specific phosphotransferase system component IID
MTALTGVILGKIIFYYIVELAERGIKYFSGKPNYKEAVKKILDSIANNKNVIDEISKMIDSKRGLDSTTAEKIIKMGYIQTQIIKMVDSTNGELNQTELENQLKTIMVKSWSDTSITDKVVNKVRKDIK